MGFGSGGGGFRPPTLLPAPPPPPTQLDPAVRRVRQSIANRARAAGGRSSTIKSGIQGLQSSGSVAKKSLLGV